MNSDPEANLASRPSPIALLVQGNEIDFRCVHIPEQAHNAALKSHVQTGTRCYVPGSWEVEAEKSRIKSLATLSSWAAWTQ